MLPAGDEKADKAIQPFINYTLIGLNLIVYIFLQKFGTDADFTNGYTTVPAEILTGKDLVTQGQTIIDAYTNHSFYLQGLHPTLIPVWLTLFTSMFLHAHFAQLALNMLFLWVVGNVLENKLGHLRYAAFYLLMGVLAATSHVFTSFISPQNSLIPCLSSSGAISGLLGACIFFFAHKRIELTSLIRSITVPVYILLGCWIFIQFISGIGLLGGDDNGGIAYSAHVGGFFAGLLFAKIFEKREIEMYIK